MKTILLAAAATVATSLTLASVPAHANCDAGEIWSKTFGGGARVQRRQGGEPGEPAARSVETAVTRVSKQQRRGRAGGFDDDVHRDGQTYRGCQAVSWPAAG